MRTASLLGLGLLAVLTSAPAQAQDRPADGSPSEQRLIWSLGMRLKADDLANSTRLGLSPVLGLRYGRWRSGPVDGPTWHRFGQIRTDNAITYDWLDSRHWRTAVSASVVNLEKDTPTDLFESGRKTLRGKAVIDYMGWSHWTVGLLLTHDLLGRGAGTALAPTVTYRQALSEDSTILLSHSFTWADRSLWSSAHALNPQAAVHAGAGWGSMDTSLTLRQRWRPHWSWFMQLHRSHALGPFHPGAQQDATGWSAQAGMIYFSL